MGILHRYILLELLRVFLLALLAFTSIFVLVGLVQEASGQGLHLMGILRMVPYVVPASLPYTIPATLLLAVTVVYGRLAAENEIMATKAAGVNVFYLLLPALALAAGLSMLTLVLHDHVIPMANLRVRTSLVSNVEDMVYAVLKKDRALKGNGLPYEIYVQRVEGKRLLNTTFKQRGSDGEYDLIAYAREATLEFDLESRQVSVHMSGAEVTDGKRVRVDSHGDKVFPIALPDLDTVSPRVRDLTAREIEARKREVVREQERNCARWVMSSLVSIGSGRADQAQWGSLVGLSARARDAQRELWRLECEPHMRRAISFGCLGFVWLGCPVAIWFQRGDYLSAFISCFLPIVLLYYPMVMFGFNLSKEGLASPLVLWGGNVLLCLLGMLAFRPVLRH